MAALAEKAVALLRRAVGESDPLIGTYVDLERVIVVRVKDGQCVPDDLDADEVEANEKRFAKRSKKGVLRALSRSAGLKTMFLRAPSTSTCTSSARCCIST